MLQETDLILFDLPDVGSRFYTYSSTMGNVLEAATAHNVEMWILDRPNPLSGERVSGWVLDDEYTSFVGKYPMPVNYGLSMGELALMAVGESWIDLENEPRLKIIKAEGWKRDMYWPETGLDWIAPSPNLPTFEHSLVYPGTVIFEGTNISEGRGTENPFLMIGAPDLQIDEDHLQKIADKHGVELVPVKFTPEAIPGVASNPKHEGVQCQGIRIHLLNADYESLNSIQLGLDLLYYTQQHSENFQINNFANKLYGINLKDMIENGDSIPSWEQDVKDFSNLREPYLLY